MMLSNVFKYKTDSTHMPFILEYGVKKILLFSINDKITNEWKPAYTDWDDEYDPVHDLNIEYNFCACNLYGYVSDNKIILSYISLDKKSEYCLYQTSTSDMINFSNRILLEEKCWSGFANNDIKVTTHANTISIQKKDHEKIKYILNNLDGIARVSFFARNQIIVTGVIKKECITFMFDYTNVLSPKIHQILISDQQEIYKSTIFNDTLILAVDSPTNKKSPRDIHLFFTNEYILKDITNDPKVSISIVHS